MTQRGAAIGLVLAFAAAGCGSGISEEERAKRAKELKPHEGASLILLQHTQGDTEKDRYHSSDTCEEFMIDLNRSFGIGSKRLYKRMRFRVKDGQLVNGKGEEYTLPARGCEVCMDEAY